MDNYDNVIITGFQNKKLKWTGVQFHNEFHSYLSPRLQEPNYVTTSLMIDFQYNLIK